MHIVTLLFILLEFCMLIFQLARFFYRPRERNRAHYLLLLCLLLSYNITGGLFPDASLSIAVPVQLVFAYGSGFLMASFFPLFFYKVMQLPGLRWHAYFGVPLFLILPYFLFFVLDYAIYGNIDTGLKYGMIVPFIYAMVLLYVMLKSIRDKYANGNKKEHLEEISMYCAISPWAALTFFVIVEASQVIEVLCTNSGIAFISFICLARSVKRARAEQQHESGKTEAVMTVNFEEITSLYKLTKREIEIVLLFRKGLTYNQIAEQLFISSKTVGNHVQHIYDKTAVNNKIALIHKLFKSFD